MALTAITGKKPLELDAPDIPVTEDDVVILGISNGKVPKLPIKDLILIYDFTRQVIPSPAFENAQAPLDSEVLTYITVTLPSLPKPNTLFCQINGAVLGNGTADNPETIWLWDGTNVTRIKDFPRKFEVDPVAFADVNNPTVSELIAWMGANGKAGNNLLAYLVGSGSIEDPDFMWLLPGDFDTARAAAILVKKPATAVQSIQQYTNGQAEIWATGAGVTFTVNPATQEWQANIPVDVELDKIVINFTLADAGGGGINKAYLRIAYTGLRGYNTDDEDMILPTGTIANTGNGATPPGRGAANWQVRGLGSNSQDIGYGVSLIGGGDGSDIEFEFTNPAVGTNNTMTLIFDHEE